MGDQESRQPWHPNVRFGSEAVIRPMSALRQKRSLLSLWWNCAEPTRIDRRRWFGVTVEDIFQCVGPGHSRTPVSLFRKFGCLIRFIQARDKICSLILQIGAQQQTGIANGEEAYCGYVRALPSVNRGKICGCGIALREHGADRTIHDGQP